MRKIQQNSSSWSINQKPSYLHIHTHVKVPNTGQNNGCKKQQFAAITPHFCREVKWLHKSKKLPHLNKHTDRFRSIALSLHGQVPSTRPVCHHGEQNPPSLLCFEACSLGIFIRKKKAHLSCCCRCWTVCEKHNAITWIVVSLKHWYHFVFFLVPSYVSFTIWFHNELNKQKRSVWMLLTFLLSAKQLIIAECLGWYIAKKKKSSLWLSGTTESRINKSCCLIYEVRMLAAYFLSEGAEGQTSPFHFTPGSIPPSPPALHSSTCMHR